MTGELVGVSRRSKRFGVAGIVPGQVVSTICVVATGCSADGGDVAGAPFDGLSSGQAGGVSHRNKSGGMIFITVNQVLVRLWARRGRKSDRMWSVSREDSSWGTGPPAAVAKCSEACVVHAIGSPLSLASIGGGTRWF